MAMPPDLAQGGDMAAPCPQVCNTYPEPFDNNLKYKVCQGSCGAQLLYLSGVDMGCYHALEICKQWGYANIAGVWDNGGKLCGAFGQNAPVCPGIVMGNRANVICNDLKGMGYQLPTWVCSK
jgi:hypothetical protein